LSRAKLSAANDKSFFLQQVMRSLQDNIAQHARRGGGGGRGGAGGPQQPCLGKQVEVS